VDSLIVGDANINEQIQDMTGIEAFANITYLQCYNNTIDTLDLSQNTLLQYVKCEDNLLTSLILGNNPNLINLQCEENQLTSLDVSQNTGLEILKCHDNNLIYLDLRNINPENIIYIVFVNNPNLTCIFVDNKEYWQNYFPLGNNSNHHYVETQEECDALGVKNYKAQKLTIYPNPVQNKLYIRASQGKIGKVTLFDLQGKKLLFINAHQSLQSLDFSSFSPGIYFLSITYQNQKLTRKIIKL